MSQVIIQKKPDLYQVGIEDTSFQHFNLLAYSLIYTSLGDARTLSHLARAILSAKKVQAWQKECYCPDGSL